MWIYELFNRQNISSTIDVRNTKKKFTDIDMQFDEKKTSIV